MRIVGVDSDLNGGICAVDFTTGEIIYVHMMPTLETDKGKTRLDNVRLHGIFDDLRRNKGVYCAVIESSITKPQAGSKGPSMTAGVHTMHQTFGGIRAASEVVYGMAGVTVAWPSAWKKSMGLTRDKDLSLEMAAGMFPAHANLFRLKKNTGIAEAALLAVWHHKKVHSSSLKG